MKVLITAANGRTGRYIISSLLRRHDAPQIRGLVRRPAKASSFEETIGDFDDLRSLRTAAKGVDAVIHYAPAFSPRESAMGIGMIDAAVDAGVRRFIYVSVINSQIEDLLNHKAKLAVEAHLINTGLDWTIVRPQHYMQNVDVRHACKEGSVRMPYSVHSKIGHVDMADVGEVAAKVLVEPGHVYASYDLSAGEHLSVEDICNVIARRSGQPIRPVEITPGELIAWINAHASTPLTVYSEESVHRLMGYYGRRGIRANPNVLTWLLGRAPTTYEQYVERSLAGDDGPVANWLT